MDGTSLKDSVLKYGLIIGIINVIISLLIYIIDISLMVNWWLGILILLFNLGLVIYLGFTFRKSMGGFLSFKSAFLFTFFTLVVAGFIGTIFRIILFTLIDPGLGEVLTELSIEQVVTMMERFGSSDEQIEQAIEGARANADQQFSAIGIFVGFLWSFFAYAIGGLIVGAIIKKNNPELEY